MTFDKDANLLWNSFITSNGNFSFTSMTENRKRPREDDTCEFMPLSKRINNLHINNSLAHASHVPESTQLNGIHTENGVASPGSSSGSERRPSYDPGINSSESTYYFNNKLLFELHMERVQRTGQLYPF